MSEATSAEIQPDAANRVVRVNAYVDAYNVYHGLKDQGLQRLMWLDYRALFRRRVAADRRLEAVKYFTSRGRGARQGDQAADQRHSNYLDALKANGGVEIVDSGRFINRRMECPECEAKWNRPQEKQTDVGIAVAIVSDAHDDRYDEAWVMCADTDLIPAVKHVLQRFPEKRVVVVPPRGRRSDELCKLASVEVQISVSRYEGSQLPSPVVGEDGREYSRPPTWS
jgi:uncharacterized LabA/DUF88 family protein